MRALRGMLQPSYSSSSRSNRIRDSGRTISRNATAAVAAVAIAEALATAVSSPAVSTRYVQACAKPAPLARRTSLPPAGAFHRRATAAKKTTTKQPKEGRKEETNQEE